MYSVSCMCVCVWSQFLKGAGADVAEQSVFLTSFVVIGLKNALTIPRLNIEVRMFCL